MRVRYRPIAIAHLADFPYSARVGTIPGIRELPIVRYPYIVLYSVNEAAGEVMILRVRHTAQDPSRHLG